MLRSSAESPFILYVLYSFFEGRPFLKTIEAPTLSDPISWAISKQTIWLRESIPSSLAPSFAARCSRFPELFLSDRDTKISAFWSAIFLNLNKSPLLGTLGINDPPLLNLSHFSIESPIGEGRSKTFGGLLLE